MQVELSTGTLSLDGGGASPLMKQVCAAARWYWSHLAGGGHAWSHLAGGGHAFTPPALHQPNQENSNDFHLTIAGVSQVWHNGADLAIGRALAHR